MTDCNDYDEETCEGCAERGGTEEVGCYKPPKANKASGSKVPCSDRVMLPLSGFIQKVIELEKHDDKSTLYEATLIDQNKFTVMMFDSERRPKDGDAILAYIRDDKHCMKLVYDVPVMEIKKAL